MLKKLECGGIIVYRKQDLFYDKLMLLHMWRPLNLEINVITSDIFSIVIYTLFFFNFSYTLFVKITTSRICHLHQKILLSQVLYIKENWINKRRCM